MENQMDIQVVAVEQHRGVRKQLGRLVVVPDSESYLIQLRLEDGRTAYLTGSGAPPVLFGDILGTR
jgi:hypothetical protein